MAAGEGGALAKAAGQTDYLSQQTRHSWGLRGFGKLVLSSPEIDMRMTMEGKGRESRTWWVWVGDMVQERSSELRQHGECRRENSHSPEILPSGIVRMVREA